MQRCTQLPKIIGEFLPARNGWERQPLSVSLTGQQFARMCDHDGVVSTQKSRWQQKRPAHFLGKGMHRGPNLRIGGHTASDDDPGDPFLPLAVKRLLHLEAQRLSHSQHIGCADITQCGRGRVGTGFADTPALLHEHGVFVEIRQRGRLQSAEAEIQIIYMGVRTREQMGIGSPPLGETIQQYPAGIWQAQQRTEPFIGVAASSSVCPSSSRDSGASIL